jgi:hypothetical protein
MGALAQAGARDLGHWPAEAGHEERGVPQSLKDQAGKPLVFAKDVITKPGETLSGIPKGVSRLFSNAATAITNTKRPQPGEHREGAPALRSVQARLRDPLRVGSLLEQPVLQDELDKIGKAAAVRLLDGVGGDDPDLGHRQHGDHRTSLAKSFNNIVATEPPVAHPRHQRGQA